MLQRFRDHLSHGRFSESISLHGANFEATHLSGIDLSGLDFSGSNFDGADLSDAWLIRSEISGCTFRRANLRGCYMIETAAVDTDFSEADLSGAYFRACIVVSSLNFYRAKLVHTNFEWSTLRSCDFRGADLRGARFYGATVGNSRLEGVDLRVTLGLTDNLVDGQKDDRTVMPGKDNAAVANEYSGKGHFWRPIKHPDGSISY